MSRSHAYRYRFTYPGTDRITDMWDDIIDRVHGHVCYAQQAGGSSVGETVDLWFWVNRAKMRRITTKLNAEFATAGDVALLADDMDED